MMLSVMSSMQPNVQDTPFTLRDSYYISSPLLLLLLSSINSIPIPILIDHKLQPTLPSSHQQSIHLPTSTSKTEKRNKPTMPRGAEYDNGIPQSDNAIEAGETKVHGTTNDNLSRVDRTAPLPDVPQGGMHSGGGAPGHSSGKGGHDPRGLGEHKGLGAHKADGPESDRKMA